MKVDEERSQLSREESFRQTINLALIGVCEKRGLNSPFTKGVSRFFGTGDSLKV